VNQETQGKAKETKRHVFGGFAAIEKSLELNGIEWRYTVSGKGKEYLLAITENLHPIVVRKNIAFLNPAYLSL
jgi:hypothetical protein